MLNAKISKLGAVSDQASDEDILDYLNLLSEESLEQGRINALLASQGSIPGPDAGSVYAEQTRVQLKSEERYQKLHAKRIARKVAQLISELEAESQALPEPGEEIDGEDLSNEAIEKMAAEEW